MNISFSFQFLVKIKISTNDNYDCENVFLERKIDFCKLTDDVMNSIFTKHFLGDIIKAATFSIQCPYRIGEYAVKNFTLNDFPQLIFRQNVFVCVSMKGFGKLFNSKRYLNIAHVKILLSARS